MNIQLKQNEYVKILKYIPVKEGRNWKDAICTKEITETRQIIGLFNWLVTQTKLSLSYDVSVLSSIVKQKNLECIKQDNEVVKKAIKEKSPIDIPDLGNLEHLKIVTYSNAPFANSTDGCSQWGCILFLVGSNNKYMPTAW